MVIHPVEGFGEEHQGKQQFYAVCTGLFRVWLQIEVASCAVVAWLSIVSQYTVTKKVWCCDPGSVDL